MEKLSKNRKKDSRNRSAPKREEEKRRDAKDRLLNKTAMNSQEYTKRDQTTPRREEKRSPAKANMNSSRISNKRKEFQAYRMDIAPQTSEDRRNRIGDEHSVGSVFKPYRSSIRSEHNSPDYRDKSFGNKTFSQTGNGFDSHRWTGKKKFNQRESISTSSEVNRVLRRNDFGNT